MSETNGLEPKQSHCPCCGIEWRRWGVGRTVQARCEQVEIEGQQGQVVETVNLLVWECMDCGCEVTDGEV